MYKQQKVLISDSPRMMERSMHVPQPSYFDNAQRARPFDQVNMSGQSLPGLVSPRDRHSNSFIKTSDSLVSSPANKVNLNNRTFGNVGAQISGTLHSPSMHQSSINSPPVAVRSSASLRSQGSNGFSFKEALQQIEDEVLLLAQEVNFCKREVHQQKQEFDQVVQLSDQHCQDVDCYLRQEVKLLDDTITKQKVRQNAEYARLHKQLDDCEKYRRNLQRSNKMAVDRVKRVMDNLGMIADENEQFMNPPAGNKLNQSQMQVHAIAGM